MRVASSAARHVLWLLWLVCLSSAWAAGSAATVVSATGTVFSLLDSGKARALAKDSQLVAGETVVTEKASSVRLRFSDKSEITLRQNSRLVIEDFNFEEAKPESDRLSINLLKGGLRALSGAVGKRGNPDAYRAGTPAGIIGIRGTDYALIICGVGDESCLGFVAPQRLRTAIGGMPAGVYLHVFDGAVRFTNKAAEKDFSIGQTAYVKDLFTEPELLEEDPGFQREFVDNPLLSGYGFLMKDGAYASACIVH